jgi:hypothetical protein
VLNSYRGAREPSRDRATTLREADATARLFLAVRQAFQEGRPVTVSLDDPSNVVLPPSTRPRTEPAQMREPTSAAQQACGAPKLPSRQSLASKDGVLKNQ